MLLTIDGDTLTLQPTNKELADAGDGIETIAQNLPQGSELKNIKDILSFPWNAADDELCVVLDDGRIFIHLGALMDDLFEELITYKMAKFKQID